MPNQPDKIHFNLDNGLMANLAGKTEKGSYIYLGEWYMPRDTKEVPKDLHMNFYCILNDEGDILLQSPYKAPETSGGMARFRDLAKKYKF